MDNVALPLQKHLLKNMLNNGDWNFFGDVINGVNF